MPDRPSLLVISQVYVPDTASAGQQTHDVCREMALRGWRVKVLTASNGYDDPGKTYPTQERLDGVEVRRLPWASLGKQNLARRLVGASSFLSQAVFHALRHDRPDALLVSTSPPLGFAAGWLLGTIVGMPLCYWVLDINPDQAIALGKIRRGSALAWALDRGNAELLRAATRVITLDARMAERLERKAPVKSKLVIIPPWHLVSGTAGETMHADNRYRRTLDLNAKLVLMYSGNLSPANPITTLLAAGAKLPTHARPTFVVVGSGSGRPAVEAFGRERPELELRLLPPQPLPRLGELLSAADVQIVSVGADMDGILHPSKLYGAMAVGRPILLLGPPDCCAAQLVREHGCGWVTPQGDVDAATALLERIVTAGPQERARRGQRGLAAVQGVFRPEALRGRFCDTLRTMAEQGASR